MTTSCTDRDHPYYEGISKLKPENRINFFMDKNSKRMKYVSLGEALDFICTGAAMNCVYWNLNSKELAEFVKAWMDAQEPRIEYKRIPDPKIVGIYRIEEESRQYGFMWNRFHADFDEALPWINYKECPRDKSHKGILKQGKIIRCAHINHQFLKPNFIQKTGPYPDEYSGFERLHFHESEPSLDDNMPCRYEDESDMTEEEKRIVKRNERRIKLFNSQEPTERIIDPCYAIISDKESYLPLETVLDRVNVNKSLAGDYGSLFPFSGFTIASYAKAWHNQPGEKKFFSPEGKRDGYKVIKKFQPISSDD